MNFVALLSDALSKAVVELPEEVIFSIENALKNETNELAKMHLGNILENARLASVEGLPVCEDTGIQTIFVDAGRSFPFLSELLLAIPVAVSQATTSGPLRPNTVNPFTGKNYGHNLGPGMPAINLAVVDGDSAVIHLLPKGGGSEQLSALWMLPPAEGVETAKKEILKHIQKAGGKPCPPIILGIGLGGGADTCMKMAKRALLRPLNSRNQDPDAAEFETELLDAVNSLGIGPMGMGGRTTALAVHVEFAPRHPATFPVGLVMQCWCHRQLTIKIDREGDVV